MADSSASSPNLGGGYAPLRYRRDVLVSTLAYHQQTNTSGCHCGWGQRPEHLGRSWPEHVADVYELAAANEQPADTETALLDGNGS